MFLRVCLCVCVCMCVFVCVLAVFSSTTVPSCLEIQFHTELEACCFSEAHQPGRSQDLPVSTLQCWGCWHVQPCLAFSLGAGSLNSGP